MKTAISSSGDLYWNFYLDGTPIRYNVYWPYYYLDSGNVRSRTQSQKVDSSEEKAHFRSIATMNQFRNWIPQTYANSPNCYSVPASGHYISVNPLYTEWIQRRQ